MPYNSRNQDNRKSSKRQPPKKTEKYYPLFSTYLGYPDRNGRMTISIKPYTDKNDNGTEITKEQWLAIAEAIYDGEFALRGSLWENEGEYSSANGNFRLTEEDLEQFPAKRAKPKPPATKRSKPVYQEPEEDEEEEEFEETESEADIPY